MIIFPNKVLVVAHAVSMVPWNVWWIIQPQQHGQREQEIKIMGQNDNHVDLKTVGDKYDHFRLYGIEYV